MERINKDIYKIKAHSNVYLFLKPVPFLIDTSDTIYKGFIKKEIETLIPLNKIKSVLLTHLHFDHVGNLDLFTNADVFAPIIEINHFKKSPDDFFLDNVSIKVIEKLKQAKALDKEIYGLKVIEVPGHTSGSVAFLDEKNKLLFSGDTLFSNGIGRSDFNNSVPEMMDASIKKLIDLIKQKDLKLCAGHNY